MSEPAPSVPLWVEVIGWFGTLAVTGAYAALSMGWLDDGLAYHALNLTGAGGILAICVVRRAWQPAALNVVWAGVALVAILRLSLS